MSIFFRIKYENCQEITSSQLDNGLLEVVVPENCSNSDIEQYLNSISSEFDVIEKKQKKATEIFRKKVEQLIEKYKKHFNLNLLINLRIQTKTRKLNDCHVELHGISFDANMSLKKHLQFVSDDILEKIVKCTVYDLACKYETLCSRINGIVVGASTFPDFEKVDTSYYNFPKSAKYVLTIPADELEKMKSDYYDASKQLNDFLKKNPILSIK